MRFARGNHELHFRAAQRRPGARFTCEKLFLSGGASGITVGLPVFKVIFRWMVSDGVEVSVHQPALVFPECLGWEGH